MPKRLSRPLGTLVESAQIIMRVVHIGIECKRFPIGHNGFLFSTEILEEDREVKRQ
jgi:hypothetical protein